MTKHTFKKYVKKNGIDDKSKKFFKKEYLDGMEIQDKDLDYVINFYLKIKKNAIEFLNIVKKMGSNFSKENYKEYLKFRKENKYDHNSKEYFQIIYGENWEEKYNKFKEKLSKPKKHYKKIINITKHTFKRYVREYRIDDKSKKFFKKEYLDGMEIKDKDLDYVINFYLKEKNVTEFLNIVKKMGSNFNKENYKKYLEFRKKHKHDNNSKEFCQIVYGKEGSKKWDEWCEKLSESHSLEGYINRYGPEKGSKKWDEWCEKQSFNASEAGYISRFGKEEGKRRYKNTMYKFSKNSSISKASIRFFDKLDSLLEDNLIYGKGKELHLSDRKHNYFYDATYQNKYIIEFHGDVYHGNPEIYGPDDHCHPFKKDITAKQLWEYDAKKKKVAEDNGYIYICFWENKKPEKAYKKLLEMGIK